MIEGVTSAPRGRAGAFGPAYVGALNASGRAVASRTQVLQEKLAAVEAEKSKLLAARPLARAPVPDAPDAHAAHEALVAVRASATALRHPSCSPPLSPWQHDLRRTTAGGASRGFF